MRTMFSLLMLFVLAGCSSWNISYAPVPLNTSDQEAAEVVVIRDATYFAGEIGKRDNDWVVAVDDQPYAVLGTGQYTMFPVSVGKAHDVGIKRHDVWWHDSKVAVNLEPGRRYFYLAGVADLYSAGIKEISAEEGQAWMAKSRYVQVANPQ